MTYTGNPGADSARALVDILALLAAMLNAYIPVIIAVSGGFVGLFILAWGVRLVGRKVMWTVADADLRTFEADWAGAKRSGAKQFVSGGVVYDND